MSDTRGLCSSGCTNYRVSGMSDVLDSTALKRFVILELLNLQDLCSEKYSSAGEKRTLDGLSTKIPPETGQCRWSGRFER